MKIGWVMGWAVPEAWFAPIARKGWPRAEHWFFAPTPETFARLEAAGPFDGVVGYSLGSLLLLTAAARLPTSTRVSLLAPIFAFPSEADLGGRASLTQVRQLARWSRFSPEAALRDFYARAGLDIPPSLAPVDVAADLQWGLQQLAERRIDPPLPDGWTAWCGANDPLLDAARLNALDGRVAVVEGATHHPAMLIEAFVQTHATSGQREGASSR
jgi:hypothetical protein